MVVRGMLAKLFQEGEIIMIDRLILTGNLTLDQRMHKNVMRLMRDAPEIAAILVIGDREIIDDDATACTNGRDEWYSRAFCDKQNDGQLRFIIIHENYHKMFRHLITWAHLWEIDPQLANMAMDFVINYIIWDTYGETDLVDWPEGGLYNPMFAEWDTARVFWYLHKRKNTPDFPANVHPKTGTSTPVSGDTNDIATGVDTNKPFRDKHDFEGAKDMPSKDKKDLEKEIDEANRQGQLVAGKLAGKTGVDNTKHLKDLLKPVVDFREQIREFVTTNCNGKDFGTWRKLNRRYIGSGIMMPSTISETVEALVCAGDMSASIGNKERQIIIGATAKAAQDVLPEEMHVLYWTTEVTGAEKYERDELDTIEDQTKPVGFGGTDPRCIPAYLREHQIKPNASIVATDGHICDWGEWDHPVLWVIIDNKKCIPPVGKYVHVSSGDLV